MNKSPFRPRISKTNSTPENAILDDNIRNENLNDGYKKPQSVNTIIEDENEKPFVDDDFSSRRNSLQQNENYISKEFGAFKKLNKTEEYQIQLLDLEQKINVLNNDLQDQTIKNGDLEKKVKELQTIDRSLKNAADNNQENIEKINKLEVLLKESRKQNLIYSNEIKDFRKKEYNFDKLNEELNYLKHENLTLKAFIVSQNKMTHYRHAFEHLTIENYCTKCSQSILEECNKSTEYNRAVQSDDADKEIQLPDVNKTGHSNVVEILKNSSTHTIQLNNNGTNTDIVDAKSSKLQKETAPNINKTILRQISEKLDLPLDSIDVLARTVIHIGDQILIRVDWDHERQVRSTVKYIGNLDERYQHRLFLGVKLSMKISEIPQAHHNCGWFRNKRYFAINSNNGYFLHFSNVVAKYNSETDDFEDFGDYLHRTIDPKANLNKRKNSSIKGLLAN